MSNRVSRVSNSRWRRPRSFIYSPLDDISQLPHPSRQYTLCITDRKTKDRHEKKIKLSPLQIRSLSVAFAGDVYSASKINADEQFKRSAKFFGKYGRHNTRGWIYLKVALLHRRTISLLRWLIAAGFLSTKRDDRDNPSGRLSGRKRAECISISFSRLLFAEMIVYQRQLLLTICYSSEHGSVAWSYNRE